MTRTGLSIAFAVAAAVGLVFAVWPDLDLRISAYLFDPATGGFWNSNDLLYRRLRSAGFWLTVLVALPAIVAPILKLAMPRLPMIVPGRAVVLMLVTLALAPGVVVNLVLKDHWDRPRPLTVTEFGGPLHFRPWWDPRGACEQNCSFVAGEAAGAFWTMAPAAVAAPAWRAIATVAALVFGTGIGVLRMAAGAHFFTDVVFAGVFTFLVIWLTHGWLYRWRRTRVTDDAIEHLFTRKKRR